MKKTLFFTLIASVPTAYSAEAAEMRETSFQDSELRIIDTPSKHEPIGEPSSPMTWRQRLQNWLQGKKSGESKARGVGVKQPSSGLSQEGATTSSVVVDKTTKLAKELTTEEAAAILKAAAKSRPTLWNRLRGNIHSDVEPITLQGKQLDLYKNLIEKFVADPGYEVTAADLKGLTLGDGMMAERIINTARKVGRQENKLLSRLPKQSRIKVVQVLSKDKPIGSLNVPAYLTEVKHVVEVQEWILEKLKKVPSKRSYQEDKKRLLEFFGKRAKNIRDTAYKLLDEPLPLEEDLAVSEPVE